MIDELSQNMVICALFVNCRKSQLVSHGRGEKGKYNFPPSFPFEIGRRVGRGGVSESHLNMGRAGESRGGGSKQEEWDEQADRRRQVYTPVGARTLRWGHSWCLICIHICVYICDDAVNMLVFSKVCIVHMGWGDHLRGRHSWSSIFVCV